jgi:hypothetical protein
VLREFPAWAIAQACRKIVCGETKLDRRFPPNDSEIFDVVAGVVRLYGENLRQAKALLDAPVDEPPPRAPSGLLAPISPWPKKAPQQPQLEPMSKWRRDALMADLIARRARQFGPCVLVEGPLWGDAEFYARWLLAAAFGKPKRPRLQSELPTDGLLKVTMVSNSGTERILAFLGQGAIVGELSIIDGLPRSLSVVAVRDAALSFLSRAAFEAFSEKHPEVYKSLVRLLAKRGARERQDAGNRAAYREGARA